MTILTVDDLSVTMSSRPILRRVSFTLACGETLGIVGASGSGKSMTALTLMRLLPEGARAQGRITFADEDLLALDEAAMCKLRGKRIGMVFQEPMTALNPLMTIGDQVAEGIRAHRNVSRGDAQLQANEVLGRVGLDPAYVSPGRYPHELSGGQRQRVVIAMAIAMKPDLIIADEPTTALDVTTQAQILDLLRDIVRTEGPGLLLISHDLAVVGSMADRIAVMHEGEIIETGIVKDFARQVKHPVTRTLFASAKYTPTSSPHFLVGDHESVPLLEAEGVVKRYPLARAHLFAKRPYKYALEGVSLSLHAGESIALIGESGSGKSTLSRLLLGIETPDAGRVTYRGQALARADGATLRAMRRDVQAVFQDPYTSLDPHKRAGWIIGEPLHMVPEFAVDAEDRIAAALTEVGLSPDDARKYPHAFSGGQRQRIALARALITRPRFLILDEPVSSLDVAVRGQILDLLAELRERHALGYLFITHDLRVVDAIAERVAVMYRGQIVEEGAVKDVLRAPQHSYTRALLNSVPDISLIAS